MPNNSYVCLQSVDEGPDAQKLRGAQRQILNAAPLAHNIRPLHAQCGEVARVEVLQPAGEHGSVTAGAFQRLRQPPVKQAEHAVGPSQQAQQHAVRDILRTELYDVSCVAAVTAGRRSADKWQTHSETEPVVRLHLEEDGALALGVQGLGGQVGELGHKAGDTLHQADPTHLGVNARGLGPVVDDFLVLVLLAWAPRGVEQKEAQELWATAARGAGETVGPVGFHFCVSEIERLATVRQLRGGVGL